MNEVDRIYEAALADEWEEQTDPRREAVVTAAEKAVELLKQAAETLGSAVDEDAPLFDLVCSYTQDIQEIMDNLDAEMW